MDLIDKIQNEIICEVNSEDIDINDIEGELLWKLISRFDLKILAKDIAKRQGWLDKWEWERNDK